MVISCARQMGGWGIAKASEAQLDDNEGVSVTRGGGSGGSVNGRGSQAPLFITNE